MHDPAPLSTAEGSSASVPQDGQRLGAVVASDNVGVAIAIEVQGQRRNGTVPDEILCVRVKKLVAIALAAVPEDRDGPVGLGFGDSPQVCAQNLEIPIDVKVSDGQPPNVRLG